VTWALIRVAVVDFTTAVLAVVSAFSLVWFRTNSAWLVIAGACIGLVVRGAVP
jgi:chromate transporter